MAPAIALISILFFLAPHKTLNAQSYYNYSGAVNPNNLPENPFASGKSLSYYGMPAGSALQGANAVPIGEIKNIPAGQYINGAYSDQPVYYSGTNNSQVAQFTSSQGGNSSTCQNCTYQGGLYSNSRVYAGGSYKGGLYSGHTYSGNIYSGNIYSGNIYSGNTYGGNIYSGNNYSGNSQVGAVAGAFTQCEPYLKSYLGYGKNNDPEEVKKLQAFLNGTEGEKLAVTGIFDKETLDAVKRFQDKYAKDVLKDSWGLSCNTGYVYITTLAKINDIVCNTNTNFSKIPLPEPRPVFYCDGRIDAATNKPLPCVATSTTSVSKNTNSGPKNAPSNSVASGQSSTSGFRPASVLSNTKNAWRKLLGQ